MKLVQCTDKYCLCNGVCVGRQQNHFIIDKIILQNLTRIQELKIRFFITWLWKEDTIYLTKNRRKKKGFPPFISVEKNGSNFVSTISTYDRQKWN